MVLIDTTTGDPEAVEAVGRRMERQHVFYLDATVGGSSRQVEAGDVIVMVGGDPHAFEECGDIFSSFSRSTFFLGVCGSGARMKLVLNLALGLHRAVLAEALAFASELWTLAPAGARDSTGRPRLLQGDGYQGPEDAAGGFRARGRLSQHLKDVRLILAAGERSRRQASAQRRSPDSAGVRRSGGVWRFGQQRHPQGV